MARLKKIYNDKARKQLKKHHTIRTAVSIGLVVFWIAAICYGGIFQHNDTIVGLVLIAIGVVNTAYTIFSIYTRCHGWKFMTIYDSDELYRNKSQFLKKDIEKESNELETAMWILDTIIAVSGISLLITGIAKVI